MKTFPKTLILSGAAFCFVALLTFGVGRTIAQDEATQDETATQEEAAEAESGEVDEAQLLTVSDDATKDELLDQMKKINEYRPQQMTIEFYKGRMEATYKINDLLLQKDLTDDEKKLALIQKTTAMLTLAQMGDEDKLAEVEAFQADANNKEIDKSLFFRVKGMFACIKLSKLERNEKGETDAAETEKLTQEMLDTFNEDEEFAPFLLSPFGMFLESCNNAVSLKYMEDVENALNAKDAEKYKPMIESLQGRKRLAALEGNEMKMEGIMLDGNAIDWASFNGKVVLVDFWATWCGPCMGEVPNMKTQYEKYNEQGFEIVGYSVDRDLDALKKTVEEKEIPWTIVSSQMTEEKNEELADGEKFVMLANYYAVNAIPRMILIGRDGKVISVNARGEELNKMLEEQFPEPESK